MRWPGEAWQYKVKLSEQAVKVSNPGIQQVRRYLTDREFVADMIYDEERGVPEGGTMVDPKDHTRSKRLPPAQPWTDLLVPVFREGRLVYQAPPLVEVRARTLDQLARFHAGIKRFVNPHQYPVGLEDGLLDLKTRLILKIRGRAA